MLLAHLDPPLDHFPLDHFPLDYFPLVTRHAHFQLDRSRLMAR